MSGLVEWWVKCDQHGEVYAEYLYGASTLEQARARAARAGWKYRANLDKDFCPVAVAEGW